MTEKNDDGHPDLELLEAHTSGKLTGTEAEAIAAHLADCPHCRLELKLLNRFNDLENDQELAEAADWSRTRFALGRAYRERVIPALREKGPLAARKAPSPAWTRWVVPVAAAAAVALLLLNVPQNPGPEIPSGLQGPLRGEELTNAGIVPLSPLGEIAVPPKVFRWQADECFDSFVLDVFTPELESLFRGEGIADTSFVLTDSLRSLLVAGRVYLWTVQGFEGLSPDGVSPSGWFRIRSE